MKEYVAKRSREGVSKVDILAINSMAVKDASLGNEVINASVGTYLDNDKKVGGIELVKDSLRKHITDKMGYPSIYGDADYCQGVMNYVFGDNLSKINEVYHPFIGATLGGTGAISMAFNLFLEENESVILPDVMWTNYKLIAKKAHATYTTHEMFDESGHFNLKSLKETIQKVREQYHHVLLVINDPCQNPTGYCLEKEEYDQLFDLLNEEGRKGYLTVLFDIAYISFFHVEGKKCELIDKLTNTKCDFLPLISFSCSKLFGMYGLRVGALIALCPNAENQDEIRRAFACHARGTYSVPNGPAQVAVGKVLMDKDKIDEMHAQINANTLELANRSKVLIESLKKYNIEHYPYKAGFFITLKIDNAFEITEKLKDYHMYVVPMNDHSIRLAISGMTSSEISKLIEKMAEFK